MKKECVLSLEKFKKSRLNVHMTKHLAKLRNKLTKSYTRIFFNT